MEDHYDDRGDDLSSLQLKEDLNETDVALIMPCYYDTDDELQDEEANCLLKRRFGDRIQCYPIDISKIARARPRDENYVRGRDPRAPYNRNESTCPACKRFMRIDDWEHTREIGQCWYPYDEPFIPECVACQDRKPRHNAGHTFARG